MNQVGRFAANLGACLVLAAMFSTSISGQSIMGTILGTVTDASGAVVPGAVVLVVNRDTGAEQKVESNASGLYQAHNLIRGSYIVRIEHPGFKRFQVTGLLLESTATVRADARLETGDMATSVEVRGEAPVIDTETMDVSDARDGQTMVRLPLNVRGSFNGYYYDMVRLTPGVVASQSNNFSFGGTRTYQFTTAVDGIISNSVLYGNSTGTAQSGLDFTQEFRVQLANGNAEFSTPGGFFATTKSGANEMHGSLFHYYSGNKLNARNTFASSAPFGILNNFGGTVGGPIIRNRTFYYAGVERFVQRSNATMNATTPTLAMRRGDFSSILEDTEIIDPLSGSPFPNNVISSPRLSPVSTKLQNFFYPEPNYGSPDEYDSNYRAVMKNTPFKTQIETRIDHRFNDANSFYGRVSWNRGATNGWPANLPTIPKTDQDRRTLFFAFGDTHSFTPTLLNEVRAGVMRHVNIFITPINGVDLIQKVGMQGLTSNFLKPWGFPQIWFDNFDAVAIDDDVYGEYYERTFQIGDNLTWIRDRHTLKFGVDLRRNSGMNYPVAPSYAFGDFSFDGSFSDFDYADFLLGIPTASSRWNPAPMYHLLNTDVSLFVQDDWKVTPKLTLNIGLRYDHNPPYHESDGRIFNFDPGSGRLIVPGEGSLKWVNSAFPSNLAPIVPASEAGFPSSLLHPYRLNFAPRLGFAYRPFSNDMTVIRGGYGLYTDVISAQLFDCTASTGPFISNESFNNELVDGVPLFAFPRAFPGGFGEVGAQSFTAVDPNLRNPRIQQWSLTVERDVKGTGIRASYIGTNNRHVIWGPNLNQLVPSTAQFSRTRQRFPEFRSVGYTTNGGNQDYHGLHVVAEHKARGGVYYQLGWVWAKNLTDAIREGKGSSPPQDSYARFLDRSDVSYMPRHSVNGNLAYELPFGPGRRWLSGSSGWVKRLLGGWSVSSILTMRSGLFFNPTFSGFDISNTNTKSGRPDRIANGNLPAGQRNIYRWFDAKAFVVPGDTNGDGRPDVNVGRFGNSAPNVLVGPGLFTMNAGLHKSIPLGERARLLLQGTFTNATNHVNYNLPNANIRSSLVGRITSAAVARSGQVAARIEF